MNDNKKIVEKARIRFYEDEHGEECDEILVTYKGEDKETSLGKFISYGVHKRYFDSESMIGMTEDEAKEYVDHLFDPAMKGWTNWFNRYK